MPGHGRHDHSSDVRHVMQTAPHLPVRAGSEAEHAPIRLFRAHHREISDIFVGAAGAVHEGDVRLIHAVLKALQIIAGHGFDVPQIDDRIRPFARIWRKLRRIAFAEIGKDEAHVFARRIASDPDFAREAGILRGLLDALACAVILPAVVNATDVVAFHPAQVHLRAAMRAAIIDHLGAARFAAIERIIHAHDTDRFCFAFRKILAPANGHPETPHESTARSAWACARQIHIGQFVRQLSFRDFVPMAAGL